MNAIFSSTVFDSLSSSSLALAELAKGPTGYFLAFLGIGLFFAAIAIAPLLAKKLVSLLRGGANKLIGNRRVAIITYRKRNRR